MKRNARVCKLLDGRAISSYAFAGEVISTGKPQRSVDNGLGEMAGHRVTLLRSAAAVMDVS